MGIIQKKLIDVNELAAMLGVSIHTIYSWVSEKKVPYVKIGRLTRFDLETIHKWIDQNTVQPVTMERRDF